MSDENVRIYLENVIIYEILLMITICGFQGAKPRKVAKKGVFLPFSAFSGFGPLKATNRNHKEEIDYLDIV